VALACKCMQGPHTTPFRDDGYRIWAEVECVLLSPDTVTELSKAHERCKVQ